MPMKDQQFTGICATVCGDLCSSEYLIAEVILLTGETLLRSFSRFQH